MTDLYLASAISLTLAALLCALSLRIAAHLSRLTATVVILIAVAALFTYAVAFHDDLRIANFLPFSSAIILGNPTPQLTAIIVGFAWNLVPGPRLRRALILMPLVGVALSLAYAPAAPATPVTVGDRWDHDVCLQTTKATCSPAAAATLLRAHGIPATEDEMVKLCLTSPDGTPMLGLYRALKLKTASTPYDIEIFHGTVQQLRGLAGTMLITAGIPRIPPPDLDPAYTNEWGWPPGLRHTVVLFDFPGPTEVDIGDPAIGRERWTAKDLQTLWHHQALRLIKRQQ